MKVKIVSVNPGNYCDQCDCSNAFARGITGWEEIGDDKYNQLLYAVQSYNRRHKNEDTKLVVVRELDNTIIAQVIDEFLVEEAAKEKQAEERKQKEKERQEKARLAKLAKKAARIKREYEEAVAKGVIVD